MGRLFLDSEGRSKAAILSYGLWQEQFGGRPDVLSTAVRLDGEPFAVVGIMPQGFAFPDPEIRAWTAWQVPAVVREDAQVGVIFRALARLRPGVTVAHAAAEATARARTAPDMGFAATALFGATGPIEVSAVSEHEALTAEIRPAMLVVLAAVVLLLITATANVASLQVARAVTRRREVAVRAAIGAGPGRLARQLVIENAVIALTGAGLGVAGAEAVLHWLPTLLPAGFPRLEAVAIEWRVLTVAVMLAVLASVVCGWLPAWHTRGLNLTDGLSQDPTLPIGRGGRSSATRTRQLISAGSSSRPSRSRYSQRPFHCARRAFDDQEVRAGRPLRLASALFPVSKGVDAEPVARGERLLRQAKFRADRLDVDVLRNVYAISARLTLGLRVSNRLFQPSTDAVCRPAHHRSPP